MVEENKVETPVAEKAAPVVSTKEQLQAQLAEAFTTTRGLVPVFLKR